MPPEYCQKHLIRTTAGETYAPLQIDGKCLVCERERKAIRSAKIEELTREVSDCEKILWETEYGCSRGYCAVCKKEIPKADFNNAAGANPDCTNPTCADFQLRELLKNG